MSTAPIVISNKGADASPKTYVIPSSLAFNPTAVTALFNGTAAASSYLACLSLYSSDGLLLARTFPSSPVLAGGSAEVTYAPFLGGDEVQPPITSIPAVGVVAAAPTVCPTGVVTAIVFDTALNNAYGMWSAGAPTRITSVSAGAYAVSYELGFAANVTGDRQGSLVKNGVTAVAVNTMLTNTFPGGKFNLASSTFQMSLNVGDYFELCAAHDAGVNLNVGASLGAVRLFSF